MTETKQTPDEALAGHLAATVIGAPASNVKRFQTGSSHYVFEVSFADREPVVVRLSTTQNRAAMQGASKLSHQLRPLGVPLPEILAEDLASPFPYIIMERLSGTDLYEVCQTLTHQQLEEVAKEIVRAQEIAATTHTAGRYGYAVDADSAPRERWSEVVEDNLNRSYPRIKAAGLFDLEVIDRVRELLNSLRPELDALPAIPFLHDTTTKNVIVAPDGTLSGIVDVDDLCFGDPRYVVALTRAALMGYGGPVHYTDIWMKTAGFSDDTVYRFYVTLFLIDLMSEHGQNFNGNQKPSDPQKRNGLLRAFDEALNAIS